MSSALPDFECFEEDDETMDYSINRIIELEYQHDIDDYYDFLLKEKSESRVFSLIIENGRILE